MKISPLVELGSKISSTKSWAKNWAVPFPPKKIQQPMKLGSINHPKKNNQPNNSLVEPQPTHLCKQFACWMLEKLWKLAIKCLENATLAQIFLNWAGWPQPDPLEEDEIRKAPCEIFDVNPRKITPRSKALAEIGFEGMVTCSSWWFFTNPLKKNMRKSNWIHFPKVRDQHKKIFELPQPSFGVPKSRKTSFSEVRVDVARPSHPPVWKKYAT